MQTIQVGCAIILAPNHSDKKGMILIAQRKMGDFLGGYWEFPGGKCELGETIEECLAREAAEELGIQIKAKELHCHKDHTYPNRKLFFHFYLCEYLGGEPQTLDCQDVRWVKVEELPGYQFPPADADIIADLIANKKKYFGV